MKKVKWNVNKSVDEVCKKIEQMIPDVLGTKHNKTKEDKAIIYYPARKFMGTDDLMDDVRIIVRKVNNSTTNVCLENSEEIERQVKFEGVVLFQAGPNWRTPALTKAYEILERVLGQMFSRCKQEG